MVQIQRAEHLAEALFLGPFEPMPFKDPLRGVLVSRPTRPESIPPHQITLLLPTYRGKLLHRLALPGLVFDPGILLLKLAGGRQRTPLALRQFSGQSIQFISPFVIADAPATKTGLLNPVNEFARAGAAVGIQIARTVLPAMLVLIQQHGQVLADVTGSVQNPI